ncbi:NrsF family protein [Rhizobium sp. 9140]|uniref:NrsF family protein n=1 Tax=Rhizobium sp. 9140 TaxID=1761900 RepID=UPI00079347AC|nr:DUF1109 domain-containing protein [Rhizobium sp. 9140]CZT37109.1 hypothetical protein GA0004734_00040820 [Rhizobium sp. 9140]
MKTDDLIDLLVQDTPVRLNLDHILAHAAIAATLIAGISFFSVIGLRDDIATAIATGRFLFKFVITMSLAVTAGVVMRRIGKPGAPLKWAAIALVTPVLLVLGSAAFELIVMPPATWMPRMMGHNSGLCLTIIPFLSFGPLACFLYALRYAAPVRPALAGAVAGVASAAIAATFYAANCDDDSPLFVMFWYPIAISIVAATGALIGGKTLRW